jgi:DnaJ-class molecular chaperone
MVHVLTPTKLSKQQKDLLTQLSKTLGKEVVHQPEKGLFEKVKEAIGLD